MVEPTDAAAATAGEGTAAGPTFECAICWQDVCGAPAALPCCGRAPVGSTTVYCTRCLEIICETPGERNSRPEASASSASSPPRHQRQGKRKAASGLGQPRSVGRCVLAVRPHRPWLRH